MKSAGRVWLVAALVAVVAAGLVGAWKLRPGPDLVPGCAPPPNESKLLDAYANDPMLRVKPAGARRTGGPQRWQACHRVDRESTTSTMVNVSYRLAADLDVAALRALFEPVAAANGWAEDPAYGSPGPGDPPDGDARIGFCGKVRGQLSLFSALAQPALAIDVRPSVGERPATPVVETRPGGLYVSIQWWPSPGAGGSCASGRPATPAG